MTVRFANHRLAFYIAVFLLSGAVLGIAAYFASIFLPSQHHDYTIFALVIPSLTIFVFLLTLQWAQPRTEAVTLFILGTLWLAMGAYSTDVIGNVQCDALGGQQTPTQNGTMSFRSYCYEMKVLEAFSWMTFVLFAIAFVILLQLTTQAQRFGRHFIWREPIRELGWYHELPGYYNIHATGGAMQYPVFGYPGGGYPMMQGGYPMQGYNYPQQQGQTLVIQPGVNGQATTVTQVPMSS